MPSNLITAFLIIDTGNADTEEAVRVLNAGLEKTCEEMPFLKGHLYESDYRHYVGVEWEDETAAPQLQKLDVEYPSYAELVRQDMPFDYFRCTPDRLPTVSTDPKHASVFAAGYIPIEGGLILSILVAHQVTDGTGIEILLKRWSSHTSGVESSQPPLDPREIERRTDDIHKGFPDIQQPELKGLLKRHPSMRVIVGEDAAKPTAPSSNEPVVAVSDEPPPPVKVLHLSFSVKKLDDVQQELMKQLPEDVSAPSKNTILCAIMWNRITSIRAERMRKSDPSIGQVNSHLHYSASMRKYFDVPDAQSFVGNMTSGLTTRLTFDEIITGQEGVEHTPADLNDPNDKLNILPDVQTDDQIELMTGEGGEQGSDGSPLDHLRKVAKQVGLASSLRTSRMNGSISFAPGEGVLNKIQESTLPAHPTNGDHSNGDGTNGDTNGSTPPSIPDALPFIVSRISRAIKTQLTGERMAEKIKIVEMLPSVRPFNFSIRSVLKTRQGGDFVVTSWANFGFYVDFGKAVGKVEWVRSKQLMGIDGWMTVWPRKRQGVEEKERIEVSLGLRTEDTEVLEQDPIFRSILV